MTAHYAALAVLVAVGALVALAAYHLSASILDHRDEDQL